MTPAAWCWLLLPIVGAMATVHLGQVLAEAPKDLMVMAFLMGIFYGVGGTNYNISIRYIGFSLTYAIAVGLSGYPGHTDSAAGARRPRAADAEHPQQAPWLMAGIAAGAAGIALCGLAGRWKEQDLAQGGTLAGF